MAKLIFRYGAMGSSKTANALMVRYNYVEKGKKVVLLKPKCEDRDSAKIIKSRIGLEEPCEFAEDFQSHLFPGVKRLKELADDIEQIKTICWCGKRAHFNARILNGQMVTEGEQMQLGGNESYTALCRKHYKLRMIES